MAYIRQVGSAFKVEIRLVRPDGQVHRENFTRDTRAQAEKEGKAREDELKRLFNGGKPRKTVRQLIERWRDEVAPGRDGAKWDINRLNLLLRLLAELGFDDMQLQDFCNAQMVKVRERRLAEVAPSSVAREESLLKAVWASARHPSWGWTDIDPFKDLGPIRGSKGKARRRKAAWPELKRILRQLGYHPRQPEETKMAEIGLAMLLALRTTLRSQEVLQLGDDTVDVKRLVITVEKHKTRYVTQEAKRVPIMPKALVLLARKCLGRGRYFTVAPASRDTMFRKAKLLAGVPDLTFHDLKRTSVMMLKQRLTDDELMAVTGNSDLEVLRRHYMTDTAAEAAKVIWKALGGDPSTMVTRLADARREQATA